MWNREILLRFDAEEMMIFRIFLKSLDFDFGKYMISKSLLLWAQYSQIWFNANILQFWASYGSGLLFIKEMSKIFIAKS